jgi:hypothetical protein
MNPASRAPRVLCLAVLAAVVAACGGGGGSGGTATPVAAPAAPPAAAPRPVTKTDLEIAQLVYTDRERTPAGFQRDPPPQWSGQVATFHLKNADLAAVSPDQPRHEVCTDDWNAALAWSEQVAQSAPAYSDLVETSSTERWFEFGRVVRSTDPRYLRMRVFRCSYVDRGGVDLGADEGSAGTLNRRPIDAVALAALSEYLWQFTLYNNFGHAVLASRGKPAGGTLGHELVIASLERGTPGSCDRVVVRSWSHRADPASGALTLETEPLWSFRAREAAGTIELCPG